MNLRSSRYRAALRATPIAAGLLVSALLLSAPAGAALSPSAYGVSALCSAPAPGYAGCLGLRLVAKQPQSLSGSQESTRTAHVMSPAVKQIEFKEPWEGSLSPENVLTAYSLSEVPAPAARQTLALVGAFDDPTAEHDLQVFDEQYDLPACTTANGCFTKVAIGSPATNAGWAQETATDIEVAHGLCPSCKILLVEAHSNENGDLEAAEREAEQLGSTEISNSWGGPEEGVTTAEDQASAFDHPGTVITAAAGDDGYLNWDAQESSERGFANYPASSPHVVAVGGTHLSLTAGSWSEETVWNSEGAGGGGCSATLTAPAWQQSVAGWSSVGCGPHRAVADVSADADPYTGVSVYDSTPIKEGAVEYRGWVTIGGTSVASPIIAATFALAGGAGRNASGETVKYPAQTLYENLATNPGSLHDVVSGSNGACSKGVDEAGVSECSLAEEDVSCAAEAICLARPGYDGPTGVGTPDGIAAFQRPTKQIEKNTESGSKGIEGKGGAGSGGGSEEVGSGAGGAGSGTGTGVSSTGTGTVGGGQEGSSSASGGPIIKLSGLVLTSNALIALDHPRAKVSAVGFAFTLSASARVHATLAKLVRVRGRSRWESLPGALSFTAAKGRNRRRLASRAPLAPGRYRLTLTPQHGVGRSVGFRVG